MKKRVFLFAALFPPLLVSAIVLNTLNSFSQDCNYCIAHENNSVDTINSIPAEYIEIEDGSLYSYEKVYENNVTFSCSGITHTKIQDDFFPCDGNAFIGGEVLPKGYALGSYILDHPTRILKTTSEGIYVDYLDTIKISVNLNFFGAKISNNDVICDLFFYKTKIQQREVKLIIDKNNLLYQVEIFLEETDALFNGSLINYDLKFNIPLFNGYIVKSSFVMGDEEKYINVVSIYDKKAVYSKLYISILDYKFGYYLIDGENLEKGYKIVLPL